MDSPNQPIIAVIRQTLCFRAKNVAPGFTLIELLITITVLIILLTFVTPSFQTILMNARMSAGVNGLMEALNYARSAALQQNIPVQVCPLGASNSTECGSSWQQGWIVVTQPTSGTAVLLHSHANKNNTLTISATGVSYVVFSARGLSTNQANFKFCDSRGSAYAQSLEVLTTGFIQVGSTPGQAVWNGGSLTCP